MTKLMHRLLQKKGDPTQNRAAIGKMSGMVGIVSNLLLFLGKLAVGLLSGSVSITADAMNNLSDASSALVTLLGFKLSEKPADADHPYGHARFEYLSGLAVAALIVVIGVELGKSSLDKILHPQAVIFSWLAVAVLGASIAAKLGLFFFNRALSKMIHSTTLSATAQDSLNDAIATGAVLAATLVERFADVRIDGWMGIAVALFILYSGIQLGRETISPLLGERASPELQELIVDYVRSQPKVLGYHDLMVHDYGPGQRFASLHVEMDEKESPLECHELIDDMERECLKNHGIHLVIHYDPVVTGDLELCRLRDSAFEILQQMDGRLQLHDFRMVQGQEHTNLIFDVALPQDMGSKKSEIQTRLEEELSRQEGKRIYTVITFDPEAFNEGK
ncbi:MAG: cation transporter [Ruminococcaceae bacterium]|nr:cation transporter [Oscillospiraceae bacterium]